MSQKPRLAPAALKLLESGFTGTTAEIAEHIYGNADALRRSMRELYAEKKIRHFDWARSGQRWVPVWAVMDGQPDEPKPKPVTQAVKNRTHRAKHPNKFGRRAMVSEWLQQLR